MPQNDNENELDVQLREALAKHKRRTGGKPPVPSQCECGAAWRVLHSETSQTTVGYFSGDGHDHDDNCTTRMLECAHGHRRVVGIRRSCNDDIGNAIWEGRAVAPHPACDWRGKAECCGPYLYVDAWPTLTPSQSDA